MIEMPSGQVGDKPNLIHPTLPKRPDRIRRKSGKKPAAGKRKQRHPRLEI